MTNEFCSLAHDLSMVRAKTDTASVTQVLRVLERVLEDRQEPRISPTELLSCFKENPYFFSKTSLIA